MQELKSYGVYIEGSEHHSTINALSPGHAKSIFLYDLDLDGVAYTDLRCLSLGDVFTSDDFKRVAKYRDIPFAYCGMRVEVDGKPGVIIGHNSSANLDVLFEDKTISNCHPNWKVKYFDKDYNEVTQ
jgi:hypothetical protein